MGILKRLFGSKNDTTAPDRQPDAQPAETPVGIRVEISSGSSFPQRPQAPDGPVQWPTDPDSGLVFDDEWLHAGLRKALNESQYEATVGMLEQVARLRRERLFQPGLDGHDQQAEMLRGRDWLEWGEHVKQMKREGYLEPALSLVYEMMDTARRSSAWDKVPPGWYNEAAVILRKLKDYETEGRLMEEALDEYPGDTRFTTRLEKARALSLKA